MRKFLTFSKTSSQMIVNTTPLSYLPHLARQSAMHYKFGCETGVLNLKKIILHTDPLD